MAGTKTYVCLGTPQLVKAATCVDRNSCLVLDVRHLPGGKISDYVEHIVSALTEATVVFSI